jgi:hypothetical protein
MLAELVTPGNPGAVQRATADHEYDAGNQTENGDDNQQLHQGKTLLLVFN